MSEYYDRQHPFMLCFFKACHDIMCCVFLDGYAYGQWTDWRWIIYVCVALLLLAIFECLIIDSLDTSGCGSLSPGQGRLLDNYW